MNSGGFEPTDQLSSSGQQRNTINISDGICPVTIKQILTATYDENEQEVRIDGVPRKQVSVVGRIVSISDQGPIEISYIVSDGTGDLKINFFVGETDNVIPTGAMVFAVGRLSATYKEQMTAFTIKPITQWDQIPFHMLQATFIHLNTLKGTAPNSVFSAHVTQPQLLAQNTAQQVQQMTAEQRAEKIKEDVIECIKSEGNDAGVSVQTIISHLGSKYTVEEIKTAIESASFNGEIYATNEDDHYAPC